MVNFAYFIPLFPLASFVFLIFYGKRLGHKSARVAIGASLAALVTSLPFMFGTLRGAVFQSQFEWLKLGGRPLFFGILIDPLSAMMLFVVTVVGTLIIIYSVGYMHEDPGFSRFFAYLSLFMFSKIGRAHV